MAADASENILIRPDASVWRVALSPDRTAAMTKETRSLRKELGLPTDRPIVMSGHQPALWHPGILAKWLAMVHAASSLGAHAAWVVVDHDDVSPLAVRVPTRNPSGALAARDLDLSISESAAQTPASARPASPVRGLQMPDGESLALEGVRDGLDAIVAACNAFAGVRSAAEQVARATSRLIHTGLLAKSPEPSLVFATALDQTAEFQHLLARMAAEPHACVNAYNTAARTHPEANIRELDSSTSDLELPLWIMQGGTRRSVRVSDLENIAGVRLAPKALLMTLLLRLYACDLFIHGLGGGGLREGAGYDKVMQEWANRWLGPVRLAPMTTVTATLRLPFEGETPVSIESARRARWAAWHARNEPSLLGDHGLSREKRSLASAIADLPRHDPRRSATFRTMRALLGRYQHENAREFETLEREASAAQAKAASDAVRLERIWPFPFYPLESLRSLRREIEAMLPFDGGIVS